MTNCPNCAAPIGEGTYCPYCGTRYPREAFANNLVQEIEIVPKGMDIRKFIMKGVVDDAGYDNAQRVILLAKAAKHCTQELARHILEERAMEIRTYSNVPGMYGTMFDVLVNVGVTDKSFCHAGFISRGEL